MKLSKIIEAIKEDIEVYGDVEALHYKYTTACATSESWMLSPDRRDKHGNRARMNLKELRAHVERSVVKEGM